MLTLMRSASGVLNPSLFEGWSTTVEEAKLLGKRLILSDIPVHREQDPAAALYLDPRDPAAWAEAMRATLADEDAPAEEVRAARAAASHVQEVARFAQRFWEIADTVRRDHDCGTAT